MLQAALAGDLKRVSVADRNFHTTLIRLSQHDLLLTTWNMVYNRVRQVMSLRNKKNSDPVQVASNHIPLIDAIKMMSTTPARIMGVHATKGSLEVGKHADIVLFNEQIEIDKTIIKGEVLYSKN